MDRKIAVIGDVMLDVYWRGVERKNPEHKAPCYRICSTEYKPGGAGNAAMNLASLGANFNLVSVLANDHYSAILEKYLQERKIDYHFIRDKKRPTIAKSRVFVQDEYRERLDFEPDSRELPNLRNHHIRGILKGVQDAQLILVSDYRKGTITAELMDALRKTGLPIIVDAKPEHVEFYHNVFMIKPNCEEARAMTGLENEIQAGEALMKKLNTNVLLTRGARGISYFGLDGTRYDFSAEERKVVDVTGAGDSVIATFAHYLVKGTDLVDCIRLANRAGGVKVEHPGCYPVSEKELE